MGKKTDLRVIRTKKLIKEALLKLIQEKGFENMTIQDIADEALINRATFYLHYQDKYDLLEQVSNTYLQELMDEINPDYHIQNGRMDLDRFQITLKRVFDNIKKNRDFYQVMFGPNGVQEFTAKIEKHIYHKFQQKFHEIVENVESLEVPSDFLLNFISSAYIGVTKWWVKENMHYSTDYMATHLAEVISKGPMYSIWKNVRDNQRPGSSK
ncbi:TetR/AcrR family transcriptional regulator [Metabacillus endolithicus]|uniref:TetR/AcrR family transcriptional regulator n=1 Tax=Metabacillus endolithicus TaxID=1535204 RepID=A0ABW5C406_9BACI|nr:TetR/AcrR family transcriptional regulator [Metabacillus endolithicus]UPG64975.1 TetR/AcrR family transcriptional regulator [Metabacillus endolithicus]